MILIISDYHTKEDKVLELKQNGKLTIDEVNYILDSQCGL